MLKLHLLSDLHLEFYTTVDYKAMVQPADVLILAGDINVGRTATAMSINEFARYYEYVIYVPGNHEYYGGDIDSFDRYMPAVLASNVRLLNPGVCSIGGIKFAGATLWTNFQNKREPEILAKAFIADFSRIKDFNTEDAKTLFNYHEHYLSQHKNADVIVTHFLPNNECTHPKYKGSKLNEYFANDITNISPRLWLFGHTHEQTDFHMAGTRFVAAPKGYPGENPNGYKGKLLEIYQ